MKIYFSKTFNQDNTKKISLQEKVISEFLYEDRARFPFFVLMWEKQFCLSLYGNISIFAAY